ncbi:YlmH/Sll1252 family protein [Ruminococcaceae bacterium OttesenSCG-928-O06]|nr:YlmH/Sll1252 family protein [Ruminococcaceae bacterium OttesenSCG-928-O06]
MRRVKDLVRGVQAQRNACYTAFLSDRQQALAKAALAQEGWRQFQFFGGYQGAERAMLCVFEDSGEISFPIAALRAGVQGAQQAPGHRDYLGAVLGLGITRECVGDILADDAGATVFVQSRVAGFLQQQLFAVGRTSVQVAPAGPEHLEHLDAQTAVEVQAASVASLRLDAVLAAVLPANRAAAVRLIDAERVQVNHRTAQSPHTPLQAGDVLSIRGVGKYRLLGTGKKSKKNRTIIEYHKY